MSKIDGHETLTRCGQADRAATAGWWKNNKGHVIIIPNSHFENIYDLPSEYSHKIHDFEREIAIALKKVYNCEGVSSRQHNEPRGNQDVWHYHLHVFPRYNDDNLYKTDREMSKPDERVEYARKLRGYFDGCKDRREESL